MTIRTKSLVSLLALMEASAFASATHHATALKAPTRAPTPQNTILFLKTYDLKNAGALDGGYMVKTTQSSTDSETDEVFIWDPTGKMTNQNFVFNLLTGAITETDNNKLVPPAPPTTPTPPTSDGLWVNGACFAVKYWTWDGLDDDGVTPVHVDTWDTPAGLPSGLQPAQNWVWMQIYTTTKSQTRDQLSQVVASDGTSVDVTIDPTQLHCKPAAN